MNSTNNQIADEIAGIWQEVLQLSNPPAPQDNFFSLGGDSLLMTMVLFRVSQALQIELPPVALLETPQFDAFGAFVESFRMTGGQEADRNTL